MLLKKFAHLFHPLKIISENSVKVRMTDFNAPIAVNAKYIISRYHESLFCTSVSNYFTVTLFQLLHLLAHYSTDQDLLQIWSIFSLALSILNIQEFFRDKNILFGNARARPVKVSWTYKTRTIKL